jgi:hypothetical protein
LISFVSVAIYLLLTQYLDEQMANNSTAATGFGFAPFPRTLFAFKPQHLLSI